MEPTEPLRGGGYRGSRGGPAQRSRGGRGSQGNGAYQPPHRRQPQQDGEAGNYRQNGENQRGGHSARGRGGRGGFDRGRGAGGRGRGGNAANGAGDDVHEAQRRGGAGGLFLLVKGEGAAKRLTKIMNMKRLQLEPDLAEADKAVKTVLANLSEEERSRLDSALEKKYPKKPLQSFWRSIVEKHVEQEHLATLHKCEYVAYFCCAATDSPQRFAEEIIKSDPKTSKYPDGAVELERAYQASLKRFNMLIQNTPWQGNKHNRVIKTNDFGKFYHALVGGLPPAAKADLFYIVGIEPPSLHALFNGYSGENIDFSIFKGKAERNETPREVATRETAEESNIDREVLNEAISRVSDEQAEVEGGLTIFPVILDLEQNARFKEWLQAEEERLQLDQVVAQMATLST